MEGNMWVYTGKNLTLKSNLFQRSESTMCFVVELRAFQCNAMKLQICTKINNISPYMLLITSEFLKMYVYDLFLEK